MGPKLIDDGNSISGQLTAALIVYSATFSRYALAVTPKNYLLFGCHAINFSAQVTQGYRYLHYWKYVPSLVRVPFFLRFWPFGWIADVGSWGGREAKLAAEAEKKGQAAGEASA